MIHTPRGYFGIGVEGISKAQNIGTIARSAHSFGANFFFTIAPDIEVDLMKISDTSDAFDHMPYYEYESAAALDLPDKCTLVGVELMEGAVELPSFRHPTRAAYILGPEMGSLSPEITARCEHVIKIPMKFCVNVGVAGALVMYDRLLSMGRFAERPVRAGGPTELLAPPESNLRRKVRTKKI